MEDKEKSVKVKRKLKKSEKWMVFTMILAVFSVQTGFLTFLFWLMRVGILSGCLSLIILFASQLGKFGKVIAVILIMITFVLADHYFGKGDIYNAVREKNLAHELTENEKELLAEKYSYDEEDVKKGILDRKQYRTLKEIRYGMEYLQEKYPGYEFEILYLDGWAGNFDDCAVHEKKTDEYFSMYIYEEKGDSFSAKDDFYEYFFFPKYDAYMEEQLKNLSKVAKVRTGIGFVEGREYDLYMEIEDVVSGRLEFAPTVNIFISAREMQEEECEKYIEVIKKELERLDIPGIYDVSFKKMTKEEIRNANRREQWSKSIIDCIISKEDGEWETMIY